MKLARSPARVLQALVVRERLTGGNAAAESLERIATRKELDCMPDIEWCSLEA